MEDNFSTDVVVGGVVWGLFKHVTRIVYIISIIITSTPPRAIRYQIPEVEDPCSFKKIFTYFGLHWVLIAMLRLSKLQPVGATL